MIPRATAQTAANPTWKCEGRLNVTVWAGIQNQSRVHHAPVSVF